MQQTVNTDLILKTKGEKMEIPKYRAWVTGTENIMYQPHEVWISHGEVWLSNTKDLPEKKVAADKVLLSRATGCKDQNGVEIFEGDIVKRDGVKRPEVVRFGEWTDVDSLGYKEQYIGFYFESEHEGQEWLHSVEPQFNHLYKVIGNIYENPQLLEGEEK